ncbi:VOC family protein [Nocardia sp. NPDC056611]|uniref:VOC family protein n=1 Tax=Nocardia sp. NPDC056611 TaxID=3345877 RepID=UPI00366B6F0E
MTTTGVPALKLEAVVIPVADVDRSKKFYDGLGWRLDADFEFDNGFRAVQFTPPGSPTSIQFGTSITTAKAGTAEGIYLVVSDVQQARDALAAQGADISEVFHAGAPGAQFQPLSGDGRVAGAADERASYGSFATFRDPDGNTFLLQEVTARIPGRVEATETSYATTSDLVDALVRAATAHGEHEARNGGRYDAEWPRWYAAYMVAEAHGDQLPE